MFYFLNKGFKLTKWQATDCDRWTRIQAERILILIILININFYRQLILQVRSLVDFQNKFVS